MTSSTYILAIVLLNAVYAAPPLEKKPDEVVILEQENNFNGVDPWRWSNMTYNNTQSSEDSGDLGDYEDPVTLPDSGSWLSPDGITYNITRNENGEIVLIALDGEDGAERDDGPPDGNDPDRAQLSGNAALSLIGRRK